MADGGKGPYVKRDTLNFGCQTQTSEMINHGHLKSIKQSHLQNPLTLQGPKFHFGFWDFMIKLVLNVSVDIRSGLRGQLKSL